MAHFPLTLKGTNLGQRHRQLNCLVNDAFLQGITFSSVQDLPEKSPLDHLFKIDLASKYKDVDYIIENLKHEDMLYVSRALKCTWLLNAEYSDIINPSYLEDGLYFEMTTSAVTKMKHWIELNLKDHERNKGFYQYYKDINFDASVKFLWKCPEEFILSEVSKDNILLQIEPNHLKFLIEKCPDAVKVFFDSLESNKNLLKKYLDKEVEYYDTLKFLLKVNGDVYLDIIEKYFNKYRFGRHRPAATKYIMANFKERFEKKPELYTSMLLDIKTLARHLTTKEIKDLILKLAGAAYLQHWFCYKNVEPLLKNLSTEERIPFKKLVFVEKTVGNIIDDWPYKIPTSLELKSSGSSVFKDKEHRPHEYEYLEDNFLADRCGFNLKRMKKTLKKKKGNFEYCEMISIRKSSLDQLFDRYRFVSFEKTLFELRKQLNVETLQHRQSIMLVLISKSGGRPESLEELLKLLTTRHENEPEHLRATVIRSLVRRCSAWRLPQRVWEMFLKFGRGVGLDGIASTVACKEGLHAVVIRNITLDQEIDPAVWKAFLEDFSDLLDYSLNVAEKQNISTKLPLLLVAAAKKEPTLTVDRLQKTLDILDAYKIPIDKRPNIVALISETARNNVNAEPLLRRLFNARIARKELFKENFAIIQSDASYCNVLKHDISILAAGHNFEAFVKSNGLKHDKFIKTLSLFFNEEDGLAPKYLSILKKYIMDEDVLDKNKLARYIAILSEDELAKNMKECNDAPKKSNARRFAASLRANCHLARPLINLNEFEWKSIGAKAVANRVLRCSKKHVNLNIQVLMTWNRTQRLALILSMRNGTEAILLKSIGEKRPRFALKTILKYLKRRKLDEVVWDVIIPLITKLNTTNKMNERLRKALSNVELVPVNKRAKYCMAVFEVFRNATRYAHMPIVCYMEHMLTEIDQAFIEIFIRRFLREEFTVEKIRDKDYSYDICVCLCMRIVAKYLLQCKSDIEQERKWENLGKTFFDHFDEIWKNWEDKSDLIEYLNDFILSLKYTEIFLNTQYMSCLPMFERIINRLQNILPIYKFFEKYISLHLTMLYFKSVRQSIKNNPTVFEDLPKNLTQAAEIVGRVFGKLISYEVVELTDKYFESVIDIYKVALREYLVTYFEDGESKMILTTNVLKSLLEHENCKIHLLAEHIFDSNKHTWPDNVRDDVYEAFKGSKSMEVQFFFYAHLGSW